MLSKLILNSTGQSLIEVYESNKELFMQIGWKIRYNSEYYRITEIVVDIDAGEHLIFVDKL